MQCHREGGDRGEEVEGSEKVSEGTEVADGTDVPRLPRRRRTPRLLTPTLSPLLPTLTPLKFPSFMPSQMLHEQAEKLKPQWPEMQPGYTVRVHTKVKEAAGEDETEEKERIQIYEGLIIGVHNGHTLSDRSFTVRKVVDGIGVERVFPWASPMIDKIEVKKVAAVRRAKLNFLRGRSGKSARISERFTKADEFQSAVAPEPVVAAAQEATSAEAPTSEGAAEKK